MLILETEHHPRAIDVSAREVDPFARIVVATRYCVLPIEETGTLSNSRVHELAGWLARRRVLFESWTLPSMRAQVRPPDAWVLLVDARLKGQLMWAIDLGLLPPWATVMLVEPGQASSSALAEFVEGLGWDPGPALVVRCDNDDALHVQYLHAAETWLRLVRPAERLLVSFPMGVCTDVARTCPVLAPSTTGHFSGLYLPDGRGVQAALGYMHTQVYRGGLDVPVRQLITTSPMWCEVLHDDNLANHARPGDLLAATEELWAGFGVGR